MTEIQTFKPDVSDTATGGIATRPAALAERLRADPAQRRYESVRDLIASARNPTPLVRLNRVAAASSQAYLKLEWMNPFGSIKDRTALYLLDGMRLRGELDGRELVEPTSGNTGIALAALAALEGVPLTVTIPSEVPEEKQVLLQMLGATVMPTPDELCPVDNPRDGAIALAHAIAESPAHHGRYAMPNQYANSDNVRAHYETTGPEIWQQTEGRVRVFVAGYGTCGTVTGVGRFLKERDPSIRIVAVEPQRGHRLDVAVVPGGSADRWTVNGGHRARDRGTRRRYRWADRGDLAGRRDEIHIVLRRVTARRGPRALVGRLGE
jgi:cysteine synthase A/cysteine synthase B